MANATSFPLTTGEYVGVGAAALATGSSAQVLELNATTRKLQGLAKSTLSAELADIAEDITDVPDAAYDWDSTALNLGVSHAAATCVISLPVEANVTNWVPGSAPRKIFKFNTSVNDIDLMAGPTCTINGAAAGTDMTPIPGSASQPSETVNTPYWLVYRSSATAYFVCGFVS